MNILHEFFEASKMTQTIIVSVNVVFMLYYLITIPIKNKIAVYGIAVLVMGALFVLVKKFSNLDFKTYFLYYHLGSIFFTILVYVVYKFIIKLIPEKKLSVFDVKISTDNGKPIILNILKGVSVQGAAGSGKTISIAGWILYWMGFRNVPGLIYDYKDFEFVELVNWFYRDSEIPVNNFSPAEPDKSVQINPIALSVLKKQEDIILMSRCIVNSVFSQEGKGNSFFIQAAEGAITGVIIKLKEDYPKYCSFSYLVAIFLVKDVEALVTFIESNSNASRQARAFLDSADSEKQMAGVKASLSNAFRMFDVPNIIFCMQKNDINLALNDKQDKSVLCLVNKPKYGEIYEPLFSIVAQSVILQMSERNREPSYLLFDEAPTLKIPNIQRVPATMRSFNIATIYMLQDKVQAVNQLSLNVMKEILANLSTLFFGKTNDPDTAKHFESYFEDVKTKQKSISKKSGAFFESGDARTTTSEKDEKKHKSYEMFKRKTGQFFVFDDKGNSYDARIKMPKIETEIIKSLNTITDYEIKKNYDFIFKNASTL
ncbi:MAG: type IV secretory system conjugative DNA transfer family protein [Cellulophaga sp.]